MRCFLRVASFRASVKEKLIRTSKTSDSALASKTRASYIRITHQRVPPRRRTRQQFKLRPCCCNVLIPVISSMTSLSSPHLLDVVPARTFKANLHSCVCVQAALFGCLFSVSGGFFDQQFRRLIGSRSVHARANVLSRRLLFSSWAAHVFRRAYLPGRNHEQP